MKPPTICMSRHLRGRENTPLLALFARPSSALSSPWRWSNAPGPQSCGHCSRRVWSSSRPLSLPFLKTVHHNVSELFWRNLGCRQLWRQSGWHRRSSRGISRAFHLKASGPSLSVRISNFIMALGHPADAAGAALGSHTL